MRLANIHRLGGPGLFSLLELKLWHDTAIDLVQRGIGVESRPAQRSSDQKQDDLKQWNTGIEPWNNRRGAV